MDTPAEHRDRPSTACPTCLGVSRGGRIRVTERTSELLLGWAREARSDWIQLRRLYIDGGHAEATRASDEKLKEIDLTIEELTRTQAEMGWVDRGQPQRSHA